MSRDKNLQEMEAGTKQSRTAVNANAKAAESMKGLSPSIVPGQSSYEDLGGPTPQDYKPDNDSAKLKDASGPLKKVSNVVNKGAKGPDAMKGLNHLKPTKAAGSVKEDEDLDDEDLVTEEDLEDTEDLETVAEEEDEEYDEDDDDEDTEEVIQDRSEEIEEETYEIEYDLEEDVNALVEGEDLSEEFKEKAKLIFEAAIQTKVEEIKEALEEFYEEKLVEEISNIRAELTERTDSYLEYVAEEWMTENELVVENGLKTEFTESFFVGLRSLFEDHYVSIPEDKYDAVVGMAEKLDEMETKLNEQIERNINLKGRLSESVADCILADVSEGLAVSQKERLASLAESVEFDSEEQYREKLDMLRESYFPSKAKSPDEKADTLMESTEVTPQSYTPSMEKYVRALSGK